MTAARRPSADRAIALAFAVLAVVWGGYLAAGEITGRSSWADGLESLLLDQRFRLRGPQLPPGEVTIVEIDDETTRRVGAFPPSRDAMARIVQALARAGASVVALDIAFLDPQQPETNRALVDALAATSTVVAAVGRFDGRGQTVAAPLADLTRVPRPSAILWPIAPVRAATRAGLVNLSTDAAGTARFAPLLFGDGDDYALAFALEVAAAQRRTTADFADASVRLGKVAAPLDLGYHLPLRFYGPRGAFHSLSAARALDGDIEAGALQNRVALIGATAAATGDRLTTPFDRSMPGVEVQATAIANLLSGRGLVRTPTIRRIDAATTVALPLLFVALTTTRRLALGLSAAATALMLWLAVVFMAFQRDLWLNIATPLVAATPVAVGYGVARVLLERRRGARLEREKATLAGFHSPTLLQRLMEEPNFLRAPVEIDAAILFVDLAGFTGASERLGPLGTRDFLAEFQSLVGHEVAAFGGVVLTFMGDGAMILFGLPDPRPDDAVRALRALFSLRRRLEAWFATGALIAGARFGATYGAVAASRLNAGGQDQISALGDPVNVASRLMEIGKQRGKAVVVSEALAEAAGMPVEADVETATLPVRGRLAPVRVRMWT